MNRQIRIVSAFIVGLFIVLTINIAHIVLVQGPELATHQGNTRAVEAEAGIRRGRIVSADGQVLADSRLVKGHYERFYPLGGLAAQTIGYSSTRYNKSGLEKTYNDYLLGKEQVGFIEDLVRKFKRPDKRGNAVTLTIDSRLQKVAEQGLAGKKGAAVAIDPKTGAILAIASSPDFDPNLIDKDWKAISSNPDAPLVNRATEGAYPPGSTFKIITSAAALEEGLYKPDDLLNGNDSFKVMGTTVRNLDGKSYGEITFTDALKFSVNTVFAQIGLKLGANRLFQYASLFGFNEDMPFDVPVKRSRVKRASAMDDVDVAWTAIGQAKTVATAFEMAMATGVIANEGVMMQPHLVSEITDPNGQVVRHTAPEQIDQVIKPGTAATMTDMMVAVTEEGYGEIVKIPGVRVASKTGTAETGVEGETHGWFVAFAPADSSGIAVAVIVEKGGTGGGSAGPIAKALLEQFLKNK
ncbi:MAG: penicillin-binding transpeptidase domain-containing protein [Actinomycetota bacterium]